jgi:hypothetical protein
MVLSAAAATAAQASETISATDGHFHILSLEQRRQPAARRHRQPGTGGRHGFLQLKAEDSTNPLAPALLERGHHRRPR